MNLLNYLKDKAVVLLIQMTGLFFLSFFFEIGGK